MNRPSLLTYAVGNMLVASAIVLLGIAALYLCWSGELSWLVGLAALCVVRWSLDANRTISDYRNWKRAWDGAGGQSAPPAWHRPFFRGTATVALIGVAYYYLYLHRNDPLHQLGMATLTAALIAMLIYAGVSGRRKRRAKEASATDAVVSICVERPLMPALPLLSAYRALPPHCMRALNASAGDNST